MTGIRFQATRTSAAQQEALGEAARRARHNAEILAAAVGGSVGRLIEITTEAGGGDWEAEFTGMGTEGGSPGNPPNPTPVQLHATVYGRWEFVPGH